MHYFATFGLLLAMDHGMNTSELRSRRNSRTSQSQPRVAGAVPVNAICEIACIILCRIVVPKIARGWGAEG